MEQIVNVSSSLVNATLGTASWTLKPILKIIEKGAEACTSSQAQQVLVKETILSLPPEMRNWIAVAGMMGASAVAIGAYGVSKQQTIQAYVPYDSLLTSNFYIIPKFLTEPNHS